MTKPKKLSKAELLDLIERTVEWLTYHSATATQIIPMNGWNCSVLHGESDYRIIGMNSSLMGELRRAAEQKGRKK